MFLNADRCLALVRERISNHFVGVLCATNKNVLPPYDCSPRTISGKQYQAAYPRTIYAKIKLQRRQVSGMVGQVYIVPPSSCKYPLTGEAMKLFVPFGQVSISR